MNRADFAALMSVPGAQNLTAADLARDTGNDLAGLIAQRLTTVPVTTPLTDLARCGCGLLVAELPRPVTINAADPDDPYATTTRRLTHVHIARPDRQPACPECFNDPRVCAVHPTPCTTPAPTPCTDCATPAVPGYLTCLAHTTHLVWAPHLLTRC